MIQDVRTCTGNEQAVAEAVRTASANPENHTMALVVAASFEMPLQPVLMGG